MKSTLLFILLLPMLTLAQGYPIAKKTPKVYTNFGISYTDDYTWLENMGSKEVEKWADEQNEYTDVRLRKMDMVYDIENAVNEYRKARIRNMPRKKGKYFYSLIKPARYATSLYYFKKITADKAELLVDMSHGYSENAVITDYAPSENSKYLAYTISEDGSDREVMRFKDIDMNLPLGDVLNDVKYSHPSWNGDKGVFYSRNTNANRFAQDSTYQLYYHAIGTKQESDVVVFDGSAHKSPISYSVYEDKLFITERNTQTGKNIVYYASLDSQPFKPVVLYEGEPHNFSLITYHNGRVYYSTNQYDWGEVRSASISDRSDEKLIVPQFYNQLLDDTYFMGGYLICKYKTLGKYHLMVYDAEGGFIKKIDIAPNTDANPLFYDPETQKLYLTLETYTATKQLFQLDIKTGEFDPYYNAYVKPKATLFPLDYFETKTITYKSRDGKDVPITIIHKKGLALNGDNPTLLEAYGGFGDVSSPNCNEALLYFLEQGGVYAYAEIRGGGEKGRKWYAGGTGMNKINGLNDFIDAAEFLIAQKYTSPKRLGIFGASHGGLVVGHAMVFRPDLFKAVVSMMGVLDVCRRMEFGTGARNMAEYGDLSTEDGFKNIFNYSPYQHIQDGVNYPAALIFTSENDDRVPPMHSYKFGARLQNRAAQINPVYIRTIHNAGHGGSNTLDGRITTQAEIFSFLLFELRKEK